MLTDKRLNFPERLLALPLTAVEGGGVESVQFKRCGKMSQNVKILVRNSFPILDKTLFSIESPHRFKKQC